MCRVSGFDPAAYLTPVEVRRLDRSHALAIGAAADALGQCGELPAPARRAVVCGIGLGAAATYEEQVSRLLGQGVRGVSPLTIPMVMPSSVAAHLSLRFGFEGPCLTVSAACASGAAAIGEGVELLRRGAADVVLAGGVDSLVNYGAMCCFMRLDAMSRNVSCPELASRPFDADRDGFVMGEGAGFVVLQRLEDVCRIGARAARARPRACLHRRRPPSGGAKPGRRGCRPLHGAGPGGRRRPAQRRGARQRARDQHGAERPRRGGRAHGAVRRIMPPGHGRQGLDGPYGRRIRGGGGDREPDVPAAPPGPPGGRSSDHRPGHRPRCRPGHTAAKGRPAMRCRIPSASVAPTPRSSSPPADRLADGQTPAAQLRPAVSSRSSG